MRYCRFQHVTGPQFGRIETVNGVECVTELLDVAEHHLPLAQPGFSAVPLAEVKLLPAAAPSKIICVGRNYRAHAKELGHDVPTEPLLFFKPPSALLAHGREIVLPPESERVDYEGELGVIIGKRCRNLSENDSARSFIRGYTIVNDVTARDLQKKDSQWTRAKGFDTFCPCGPIVTDELDPWAGVELTTRLNGEVKQQGNTREFIFPLDEILRYASRIMTLEPGDLIATGTPEGVSPMKSGDAVEVSVAGIGALKNKIR